MPLSRSRIQSRIEAGEIIIDPFSENNLTPNGYDLSLSSQVYTMEDIGRDINPLNRSSLQGYLHEKDGSTGEIVLEPFEPVSILSEEKIGIDPSLMVSIEGRSSMGKLGVFTHFNAGIVDSGFGFESPQRIVFTLMSCNPNPVVLHPGQSVAQLLFHQINDPPEGSTRYSDYNTSVYPGFDDIVGDLIGNKIFIGITGLAATGKSEVADILSELLDAETHSMGEVVREKTKARNFEPTSENINKVSRVLREEHGPDVIAKRLIDEIENGNGRDFNIIEGIRSPDEIEVLQEKLDGEFAMIGIHSSRETRISRMVNRGRSDDEMGEKALDTRDRKETEFGVREALTMSDHIITNEGSLSDLERDVEQALAKIIHTRRAEK